MPKSSLIAVAIALGLTACAHGHFRAESSLCDPKPLFPKVFVVERQIVVDQEPIFVPADRKNVRITWELPEKSGYRFPSDGIVFERSGEEITDCRPESNGQRYSCYNRHSKPGRYKYTIRVEDVQGKPLEPLDPFVMNG